MCSGNVTAEADHQTSETVQDEEPFQYEEPVQYDPATPDATDEVQSVQPGCYELCVALQTRAACVNVVHLCSAACLLANCCIAMHAWQATSAV